MNRFMASILSVALSVSVIAPEVQAAPAQSVTSQNSEKKTKAIARNMRTMALGKDSVLEDFVPGIDNALLTPKLDLHFTDGSLAHLTFFGSTTEDIKDVRFDPSFDSSGAFVFYMPLGLYQTVLQMCRSHKTYEVCLTVDDGIKHDLPAGSYYFNLHRAFKKAASDSDKTQVSASGSGFINGFEVVIVNSGSFHGGNGNMGSFAIPYGPSDGHANPMIELCFKDLSKNFPRAYYQEVSKQIIHFEVPGDMASGLYNVLDSIDKVPLKFTWTGAQAELEANFPGSEKSELKFSVAAVEIPPKH